MRYFGIFSIWWSLTFGQLEQLIVFEDPHILDISEFLSFRIWGSFHPKHLWTLKALGFEDPHILNIERFLKSFRFGHMKYKGLRDPYILDIWEFFNHQDLRILIFIKSTNFEIFRIWGSSLFSIFRHLEIFRIWYLGSLNSLGFGDLNFLNI